MSGQLKRDRIELAPHTVESDDEGCHREVVSWLAGKHEAFQRRMDEMKESYITCDGPFAILQILPSDSIIGMKPAFCSKGPEGIELKTFVRTLLRSVARHTDIPRETRPQVAISLAQLFRDIDTDSSGFVSWAEFSSYVVEVCKKGLGTGDFAATPFTHVPIGRALPRVHKASRITFHSCGLYLALEPQRVLIVPDPALTLSGFLQGKGPVVPGVYARTLRLPHHTSNDVGIASDFAVAARRVRAHALHLQSSLNEMREALVSVNATPAAVATAARIERSLALAHEHAKALTQAECKARQESSKPVAVDSAVATGAGGGGDAPQDAEMFAVDKVNAPAGALVTAYSYAAEEGMLFIALDSGAVSLYRTDLIHATRPKLMFVKSITLSCAAGALAWHRDIQLLAVGSRNGHLIGLDFRLERKSALVEHVVDIEAHMAAIKDLTVLPHTGLMARVASAAPDPVAPVVIADLVSGAILMTLGGPGAVQLGQGTTGLGAVVTDKDSSPRSLLDPTKRGLVSDASLAAEANRQARAQAEARLKEEDALQDASVVVRMQRKRHWKGAVMCVYHPGAQVLVTAGFDLEPKVWIPHPLRQPFASTLRDEEAPHKATLVSLVPLGDGRSLLTADEEGLMKVWNLQHATCTATFELDPHQTRLQRLSFKCVSATYDSIRHRIVGCGIDDTGCTRTYFFDGDTSLARKRQLSAHDGPVTRVAWSPAVGAVATFSFGECRLWSPASGVAAHSHTIVPPGGDVCAVSFDATVRRAFVATRGGLVSSVSVATGSLIGTLPGIFRNPSVITYINRAGLIAVGCETGKWHLVTERSTRPPLTSLTYGAPTAIEDSEASSLVAVADDVGMIVLYDTHSLGSVAPTPVAELCHRAHPPAARPCAQAICGRAALLDKQRERAAARIAAHSAQVALASQRRKRGVVHQDAADEGEGDVYRSIGPSERGADHEAAGAVGPRAGALPPIEGSSPRAKAQGSVGGLAAFESNAIPSISCVCFLDPFPVLVACDTSGRMVFWRTRAPAGRTGGPLRGSAVPPPGPVDMGPDTVGVGGGSYTGSASISYSCMCAVEVPRSHAVGAADRIVPVGTKFAWFASHMLLVLGDDIGGVSWVFVRPLFKSQGIEPLTSISVAEGTSGGCVRSLSVAGASRLLSSAQAAEAQVATNLPILLSHNNTHSMPVLDVACVDSTLSSSLSGDVARAEVCHGENTDHKAAQAVCEEDSLAPLSAGEGVVVPLGLVSRVLSEFDGDKSSAEVAVASDGGTPSPPPGGTANLSMDGGGVRGGGSVGTPASLASPTGTVRKTSRRGGVTFGTMDATPRVRDVPPTFTNAALSPSVDRVSVDSKGNTILPIPSSGRRLSLSPVAPSSPTNEWGGSDAVAQARQKYKQFDRGLVVVTSDAGGRVIVWTLGGRLVSELRQTRRVRAADTAMLAAYDSEARDLVEAAEASADADVTPAAGDANTRLRRGVATGPRWSIRDVGRVVVDSARVDSLAFVQASAKGARDSGGGGGSAGAPSPALDSHPFTGDFPSQREGQRLTSAVDVPDVDVSMQNIEDDTAAGGAVGDSRAPAPGSASRPASPLQEKVSLSPLVVPHRDTSHPSSPPPPPLPPLEGLEQRGRRVNCAVEVGGEVGEDGSVDACLQGNFSPSASVMSTATPSGASEGGGRKAPTPVGLASFAQVAMLATTSADGTLTTPKLPKRGVFVSQATASAQRKRVFKAASGAVALQNAAGRTQVAMQRRLQKAALLASGGVVGGSAAGDDGEAEGAGITADGGADVVSGGALLSIPLVHEGVVGDGSSPAVTDSLKVETVKDPLGKGSLRDLSIDVAKGGSISLKSPSAEPKLGVVAADSATARRSSFVPLWEVGAPPSLESEGGGGGADASSLSFWAQAKATSEAAVDAVASPPPSRPPSPSERSVGAAGVRVALVRVAEQERSVSRSGRTCSREGGRRPTSPVGTSGPSAQSFTRRPPNEVDAVLVRPGTLTSTRGVAPRSFTRTITPKEVGDVDEDDAAAPFSWAKPFGVDDAEMSPKVAALPRRRSGELSGPRISSEVMKPLALPRVIASSVSEGRLSSAGAPRGSDELMHRRSRSSSLMCVPLVSPSPHSRRRSYSLPMNSDPLAETTVEPLTATAATRLFGQLPAVSNELPCETAAGTAQGPGGGELAVTEKEIALGEDVVAARLTSLTEGGAVNRRRSAAIRPPEGGVPSFQVPPARQWEGVRKESSVSSSSSSGGYTTPPALAPSGGHVASGRLAIARPRDAPAASGLFTPPFSAHQPADENSSSDSEDSARDPSAAAIFSATAAVLSGPPPAPREYPVLQETSAATLGALTSHVAERARAVRLRQKEHLPKAPRVRACVLLAGDVLVAPPIVSTMCAVSGLGRCSGEDSAHSAPPQLRGEGDEVPVTQRAAAGYTWPEAAASVSSTAAALASQCEAPHALDVYADVVATLSAAGVSAYAAATSDLLAYAQRFFVPSGTPAELMKKQNARFAAAAAKFAAQLGPSAAETQAAAYVESMNLMRVSHQQSNLRRSPLGPLRGSKVVPPAPVSSLSPMRSAYLKRDPRARSLSVVDERPVGQRHLRTQGGTFFLADGAPPRTRPYGFGGKASQDVSHAPRGPVLPYVAPPIPGLPGEKAEALHKAVVGGKDIVATGAVASVARSPRRGLFS